MYINLFVWICNYILRLYLSCCWNCSEIVIAGWFCVTTIVWLKGVSNVARICEANRRVNLEFVDGGNVSGIPYDPLDVYVYPRV